MTRPRTIDIHAHILPQETILRLGTEAPRLAPKVQRPMPRECSDLDLRLAHRDAVLGRRAEELLRNGRP